MSDAVRPPSYSSALLLAPAAKSVAARAHSGSKFLQCPHHGAKNSTSQMSSELRTWDAKLASVNSMTSLLPDEPLELEPPDSRALTMLFNWESASSTMAWAVRPPA
ncbi:hypothetical protein BpHYR1_005453 [Brachionus plicatilis]|uniref:Uncharacterized protein n=1 Tax=Brachionus plicatilis TaxID=10195 RepID=A0A3M7S3A7_BRAPC|nr:hypothetical protein BpHYR1_005453 [Brachionus plicatilis]